MQTEATTRLVHSFTRIVEFADLDANNHVNNVAYLGMKK